MYDRPSLSYLGLHVKVSNAQLPGADDGRREAHFGHGGVSSADVSQGLSPPCPLSFEEVSGGRPSGRISPAWFCEPGLGGDEVLLSRVLLQRAWVCGCIRAINAPLPCSALAIILACPPRFDPHTPQEVARHKKTIKTMKSGLSLPPLRVRTLRLK